MRSNKESIPQLQDDSVSDWVYVRLVSNSKYRDDILHALGQVMVAHSMSSDLDTFGIPASPSSPNPVKQILGLEHGTAIRTLENVQLTHEPLNRDQDIKIQYPPFLSLLLDRLRSPENFVDLNETRQTLLVAPTSQFFDLEGARTFRTPASSFTYLLRSVLVNAFVGIHSAAPLISQHVETAVRRCKASQDLDPSEVLLNFILVWYASLVRLSPWKRRPVGSILKKICATLTVDLIPSHMP